MHLMTLLAVIFLTFKMLWKVILSTINALESEFSNQNKAFEIEILKKKKGLNRIFRYFHNVLSTLL